MWAKCRGMFERNGRVRGGARDLVGLALVAGLALIARPFDRPAFADLIYFPGPAAAQVPATVEGDHYVLTMPNGALALPRDEVVKRVPGFWPPSEWPARRDAARGGGFEARFAAAWWAIENGLTLEAVPELRALHKLEPNHRPTARMVEALDRLERPCGGPDVTAFRAALGTETKTASGPHVLVFHQHSESEAAERVDVLERVIVGFHLAFAARGIELRTPREKLVSAWFADREDYLAFLRGQNGGAFTTTTGYYHPTWRAMVAYDTRSGDKQKAARARLKTRRDELKRQSAAVDAATRRTRLRVRLGDAPARTVSQAQARAVIERLRREADVAESLLEIDRRAIDFGTAAHETVHQLVADSGLAPTHDAFPYWLHEGLAAQFEVVRGGRWAGIGRAHDLRMPDWRAIADPMPLERLLRDGGFGHGYARDAYARAWALVYYLLARKPARFLAFLDLLRNPPVGSDGGAMLASARADRTVDAFQRAFGADLPSLEREWRQFMTDVQTPLEQFRPDDAAQPDRAPENRQRPDGPPRKKP